MLEPAPAPARPDALTGEGLVAGYGRREVLHGIDLALRPGTVTALLGPNGSGKSTALRALARLHPLTGGEVRLGAGGRSTASLPPRALARELTLFTQSRATPQGLTVREVVAVGRHPHRRRFAALTAADRAAIDRALDLTGTTAFAERGADELSGGEMQRVWLAACLAQDTAVLLLDEPTNHLDLRFQIELLDLVRDLAELHGVAVGIVLHDLAHAARIADHVVLLHHGAVHSAGPAAEVLTSAHLSEVYEIPLDVTQEADGRLRIDAALRAPAA